MSINPEIVLSIMFVTANKEQRAYISKHNLKQKKGCY